MTKGTVAYIIISWNNRDILDECIDSIDTQSYPHRKIILVDNNSADSTVEDIEKKYPHVKIIALPENTGFTGGNNIGIAEALKDDDTKFVALINSDARLDQQWTSHIVEFSQRKPKSAILQGTTLDYYDHNIVDSYYIFLAKNGQATQAGWRERYNGEAGPLKVFGTNAAACIITRSFIESQPFHGREFFDEKFFMYLEDVDISARATVMGWDNYLVPNARAFHMGSASSGKNPGFSLYMTFRNNSAMIFKNFGIRHALKIARAIPRSDFDTYRHLRRLGKNREARLVYKGRFIGLLRLPLYISDRHKMRKFRQPHLSAYLESLMKVIHTK